MEQAGMYPVLRAGERRPELEGVCALAVMAKAPQPGKVKTRLAPVLGFDGSAAINVCFLKDTTRNIAEVCAEVGQGAVVDEANPPAARKDDKVSGGKDDKIFDVAAGLVCYTPVGEEALFDGILPEGFALISQRGDAFGERLLAAAEDILSCGYGAVCLIDSDSPTVPAAAFALAIAELAKHGDRVVIGGSDDGGYYLIGLKHAHAAPFERITWSTGSVFAETMERCVEAGLEVVELPLWYDVDDADTLKVLEAELLEGKRPEFATRDGYAASATRDFLLGRVRA